MDRLTKDVFPSARVMFADVDNALRERVPAANVLFKEVVVDPGWC